MAEREQHPANVDPHLPTALSPESREETIAKAVGEADAAQEVTPHVTGEDGRVEREVERKTGRTHDLTC